jgi:hypothetical protein
MSLLSCRRDLSTLHGDAPDDTTSHNFIWEIDTLPGVVYDIDALDENNAWLVGEFWKTNPENGEIIYYNFGQWDGQSWHMLRVIINGGYKGIRVFNKDDIWITNGIAIHWDGQSWTKYHFWDMGVLNDNDGPIDKMYGVSPNNLYFIGLKGTIIHYDGTTFTKMESGTEIRLTHIYGTDENHIWVVGDDGGLNGSFSTTLLFYNGQTWQTKYLYENSLEFYFHGIWADQDSVMTCISNGYLHEAISSGKGRVESFPYVPIGAVNKIFGRSRNDLFVVGYFGTLQHFNGKSWFNFIPFNRSIDGFLSGCYASENSVFVGGYCYVYRGYR